MERDELYRLCNAYRDAIGRGSNTPGWRSKVFSSIIRWPSAMYLWNNGQVAPNHDDPHARQTAAAFYNENFSAMNDGVAFFGQVESLYDLMFIRGRKGQKHVRARQTSKDRGRRIAKWPDGYFDDHIWFERFPENVRVRVLVPLDPSKERTRGNRLLGYVDLAIGFDGLIYVDADLKRRGTPDMVADGVTIYIETNPMRSASSRTRGKISWPESSAERSSGGPPRPRSRGRSAITAEASSHP